ncbi:MAG: hypothetical protein GXP27_14630 [Planctomycetes bacterium]|nr:hypothetical protein [Planctomycetota bacterium]
MTAKRDYVAEQQGRTSSCNCESGGGCESVDRRRFLQWATAAVGTMGLPRTAIAGPFGPDDTVEHFVPAEKKLSPDWVKSLFDKGTRTWYRGEELETIGMPIGGICAGQLYLAGDGRLIYWDIFNKELNTGWGAVNYKPGRKPTELVHRGRFAGEAPDIQQGFALRIRQRGKTTVRSLDRDGFPGVRFCGEYPIGYVEYADPKLPVRVSLEAFSPFIPLNAADSALPATLMTFTVKNVSSEPVEVTLAGWLQNAVGLHSEAGGLSGRRRNRVVLGRATTLLCQAEPAPAAKPLRPAIIYADFENGSYGDWTIQGEAFGQKPARGTLPGQQPVSGFRGQGLVNTFLKGDRPRGRLTSPEFTIERPFISFLIGGGGHAGQTCINLLVDGQVVRTATGRNRERLTWHNWDVRELKGKKARLQIVDDHSGGWGHINIDQIEFRDTPREGPTGPLDEQPDFGAMALALLTPADSAVSEVLAAASVPPDRLPQCLFAEERLGAASDAAKEPAEQPFGQDLCGAVGGTLRLEPGQTRQALFVVAWHFPNRPQRGHFYATRFQDVAAVVGHVQEHLDRLAGTTRLWHDTYYDSTLPHWLLDRLHSTVSTLATGTCQWWANGRFWGWEGVGCCRGTCGHVWNYAHAVARLFPELERSVRERQDFSPDGGFIPETGEIRFRGENWRLWAGDAQAGYILKAYREHLCSADDAFLKRNWKAIRKAMEFLIAQDRNADGLIEGKQHNTYDIDFYGANPMIGSLYLAALRAAEEMAQRIGETDFAMQCRRIFETGQRLSVQKLFNGEYFIQLVDLEEHPRFQHADGCLSDQLFGQGWAEQLALGEIYPHKTVRSALQAIWKYNWAPDVGPQNQAHKPERWFAYPGEAGLFTCTWPRSKYLEQGVRYKNEVWTGIEYQVAGHMAWEGMLTEALAICRAIHDRYQPPKHNPWNEIECGDHYARGMASWGVLIGLAGFEHDGPRGHLGFAPRLTPENFRAVFTASEGWGTIEQTRTGRLQTSRVTVRWGRLRLKTLALQVPTQTEAKKVSVTLAGRPVSSRFQQTAQRLMVELSEPISLSADQTLEIVVT